MTTRNSAALTIIDAPSNLGLRPPEPGSVPGADKAPLALREAGLHARLDAEGAEYAGAVVAARYRAESERPGLELRNHHAIVDHSRRLAARIAGVLDSGRVPLVIGGDCSILIAAGLVVATARERDGERRGLVHIDGHTDFRHPGNSSECASLAGEDLAAAIGRHWPAIADIDGLGPYFDPADTVHIGCRDADDDLDEVRQALLLVVPARAVSTASGESVADEVLGSLAGRRYWLHIDVDVLDPSVLSAVDSPDAGGLSATDLVTMIRRLLPLAIGVQFTVFDPDRDPDGSQARLLTDLIVSAIADDSGRD